MIKQTVVAMNNGPLIVTYNGKEILEVMRPDGSTFVPNNPRFIARILSQLPADNPACHPGGCTPEALRTFEADYGRVSLFRHDGTRRTNDEVREVAQAMNEGNRDGQ